jgi:hypothetical protein
MNDSATKKRELPMNKFGMLAATGLATLVLVSAAIAKKPTPSKPAGDYFPLRVGDSWTYRNSEEGGYTFKVISEEPQAEGASRFVVELSSGVKILNTFSKADGWVLLHAERYPEHEGLEAKYEPPKQYLANPLTVGLKWEWSGKDPAQMQHGEKNTVAGVETVTVQAGKFRAMKVVSTVTGGAIPMTRTNWYADGIGLVKSTTEGGKIKYGSELTDYSFKKK